MPVGQCCITSYIKKAGRTPRVLPFAVSKLLMSAETSLFSFPEDGFCFSFLREHPCLAQGAACAGSSSSCWHRFAAQPPLKVNLQSQGWDKVRELARSCCLVLPPWSLEAERARKLLRSNFQPMD